MTSVGVRGSDGAPGTPDESLVHGRAVILAQHLRPRENRDPPE